MGKRKKNKDVGEETAINIPPNASSELVEERMAEVAEAAHPTEDPGESWETFHDRGASPPDPMLEEGEGMPVDRVFWRGGPLDTVDGMPWHTAFAQCPPGKIIVLLPGTYRTGDDESGNWEELTRELGIEVADPAYWTPEKVLDYIGLAESQDEEEMEDPEYVSARGKLAEGDGRRQTQQMRFDGEGGMKRGPVATILHKPRAVPVEIKLANNQFKINTTEEGQENVAEKSRDEIREWVIPRMKVLKDATIRQGDFDAAVDLMVQVILGEVDVEEVWKDNVKQASAAVKGEA